jgi:hypothetical protein
MQSELLEIRQYPGPTGIEPRNLPELGQALSEAAQFRDLFIACLEGNLDVIDQQFNMWVTFARVRAHNPNAAESFFSPLHVAAAYGNVTAVQKILELSAIKSKEPTAVKVVKAPWDVNDLSYHPEVTVTALDFACKYNHPKIVSVLLDAGAKPETSTPGNHWLDEMTPLMWCIHHKMNLTLIKRIIALLKKGDTLNARSHAYSRNALEWAIYTGEVAVVRELLLSGAKPNVTRIIEGGQTQTPLSFVLSFPSSTTARDLAELLLAFDGVTVSVTDENPKSFSTPAEAYKQAQRLHKNFISEDDPGFLICRAAHRLINKAKVPSGAGDQEPTNLLRRLLEYLPQRQLLVVKYVRLELQREESGWLNSKTPLALNPKSFHNVFLQALSQNNNLLRRLNISPIDQAKFPTNPAMQSEFLQSLLKQLKAYQASCSSLTPIAYSHSK